MRVAAGKIREQLVAVLAAWGMSAEHAAVTAEMMVETDLRGRRLARHLDAADLR